MNIYRQRFTAPCCNNGLVVIYDLELRTDQTIMVEDIQAACQEVVDMPQPYHENIADFLIERFGGEQIIRAHHHGTDIETRRRIKGDPCGDGSDFGVTGEWWGSEEKP